MAYFEIKNLWVEYQKGKPVLENFNFKVNKGQLVSLLGPSGCGKTTTLRAVAGLIEAKKGTIIIGDRKVSKLPPNKRDIGLVFQNFALFPHMTVFDNVAFGLKMRNIQGAELAKRVERALDLVDLIGFSDRRPGQLSGGQQQRVAVARAIVIEPTLLLFDEPLSDLDAKLRVRMRADLRRIQQELDITSIYVTHDQVEALAISDRVAVMHEGKIEQDMKPERIFKQPGNPFVASFMGFENHFKARVERVDDKNIYVQTNSHVLAVELQRTTSKLSRGEDVSVYFRAEGTRIHFQPIENSIPCKILVRTFHGSELEYIVETALGEFVVRLDEVVEQTKDEDLYLVLDPGGMLVFPGSN